MRIDTTRQQLDFARALALLEAHRQKRAFVLLRELGRSGFSPAYLNLGYCYETGTGVRRSERQALAWYKKGVRCGNAECANNIGTIYRDHGRLRLAERWFRRAVALGANDSLLSLAKMYVGTLDAPAEAVRVLRQLLRARDVTEDSREQAQRMLGELDSRIQTRRAR